jgi:hypothetical protein
MTGMLFTSKGFSSGSPGYILVNIVSALGILGATGTFLCLLTFEVYRSVKVRLHVFVEGGWRGGGGAQCAMPATCPPPWNASSPWLSVRTTSLSCTLRIQAVVHFERDFVCVPAGVVGAVAGPVPVGTKPPAS